MIVETNDKDIINNFLLNFSVELSENPFRKYLLYDDVGILIYSEIYDRLEIDYLFIIPTERHKGIASKLLERLFELYNYSASLEVKCDNDIAIKLYEKFDFKIETIRKGYYDGIDGYLMVRK